jgi:murein DD-endopeptidase MepM/ murein hydrolase activator NlpD
MRAFVRNCAALTVAAAIIIPLIVQAQTASTSASTIQKQIDDNNAQISTLNNEIAQYQTQLNAVSSKKQTLQNTLTQLNLSIKKLTASISVTKNQINSTQLQIQQLSEGIAGKQSSIKIDEGGLSESLRALSEAEAVPLVAQVLNSDNVATAWQDVDATQTLQGAVNGRIATLAAEKQSLTDTKSAKEDKVAQLLKQQKMLTAQQGSLNATKNAQNELLAQTKNQEANFQAIISQKKSQEASLEAALIDLKSQYNQAVNPSEITPAGQGILQWPIFGTIRITQYFGNTPFAQTHAALYSGNGHDGLDIAAPIGTPVHAALTGTILATGNTDAIRGCYSFGKWVMIKHNNGINTMYAHLSQINVSAGQAVGTGDVIGYSGETGYATGPHLHFGVYVSSVTQIITLGQATKGSAPCSRAVMPVPPVSGYLNPLNYLPATTFIDNSQ